MSQKGPQYERDICKKLSFWWSLQWDTPRDDLFWRTSNSGGRATTRHKQGKTTRGQHNDITATDPASEILTRLLSFEIKRGYTKKGTIFDLLDSSSRAGRGIYTTWLEKLITTSKRAKTPYWMLIVKRDRKKEFCFFPLELYEELRQMGVCYTGRVEINTRLLNEEMDIVGTELNNITSTLPKLFEFIAERKCR